MKVKKIVCLNCNTELVSDYDKENYEKACELLKDHPPVK